MSPPADGPPVELPSRSWWVGLGVELGDEVVAGHQSRVFRATGPTGPIVVKLVDRRRVDAAHRRRVEAVARLAEIHPAVVGPIRLGQDHVIEVWPWLVSAAPFIDGDPPDDRRPATIEAMGAALARLHAAMSGLGGPASAGPTFDLPVVAALAVATERPGSAAGQLIHGDFAAANLIESAAGLRIIDLDQMGRGTIPFEIGNTLYMAIFDGWSTGDVGHASRFRDAFIDGYRRVSGFQPDDEAIDDGINRRMAALRHWLDHPATAPAGIAWGSPSWHRHLRRFLAECGG